LQNYIIREAKALCTRSDFIGTAPASRQTFGSGCHDSKKLVSKSYNMQTIAWQYYISIKILLSVSPYIFVTLSTESLNNSKSNLTALENK